MFSVELGKASLGFCAAHFLVAHEKCSRMHGHNYKVRVAVQGQMDEGGMVVDFGYLKERTLEICRELDGRVILAGESPQIRCRIMGEEIEIALPDREYILPVDDVKILPVPACTAEALARYFHERLSESVPGLAYVEIEESPGSVARYSR